MKTTLILLNALVAVTGVSAQDVLADVMVYNSESCGKDANDPNLVSSGITVFKDVSEIKVVDGKPNGACMRQLWSVPGFEEENGQYNLHIDENTIPEDCEMVFYVELPAGSSSSGPDNCATFVRRVPSADACTTVSLRKEFGYAMCCGDENCSFAAKNNPFTSSSRAKRNVAAVKKSPLLRRDGCTFTPDDANAKPTTEYGPQVIISNTYNCPGTNDCEQEFQIGYSVEVTNSWGAEASLGGELWGAITASVSMSHQWSESKQTSWNGNYKYVIPAGGSGYMTFQPELECSPAGKFGDSCSDGVKGQHGKSPNIPFEYPMHPCVPHRVDPFAVRLLPLKQILLFMATGSLGRLIVFMRSGAADWRGVPPPPTSD
ncbi:uncharacterized protein EI97DRAFT_439187 [Westerdykella ornata]|uniref:Uncharacterized protein n=1 Tax=Westerdykella ornata TaxID=318751 RepID=A0A6A6JU71_WESOR|nr:uncharacterized protein EI97DRAFT_439187 [Westerdykella ornata]KAF2280122.1 hypothetical protein EI97DRAFT_439187 [Westerdykella ornata]